MVQFTSLGVMFRSPYTCDPAKYLHGGAHKGELSISFPAFKGTLMGMQSYDATGVFHDLGKNSGTQLWSPDNEVQPVFPFGAAAFASVCAGQSAPLMFHVPPGARGQVHSQRFDRIPPSR